MKTDETNFISLIRQGKEEGIRYVIEAYGGFLEAVVRKRLYAMPELVEECMNDIFFGIWKNIGSYDEDKGTFQNWVAGVARLEAIDCLRRHRRQRGQIGLEDVELAEEDQAMLAVVNRELSEETQQILSCLSPKDRELFQRLYLDQEDPASVGAAMGMSRENVYMRVSRGKKKLRKLFTKVG